MRLAPDFGIVGYTDRWQYFPGDDVSLHLSSRQACQATVRLHRFEDIEEVGAGVDFATSEVAIEPVACEVTSQDTVIGSWFVADLGKDSLAAGFTLGLLFQPSYIAPEGNGLVEITLPGIRITVTLDDKGHPVLSAPGGGGARVRLAESVTMAAWHALLLICDRGGRLRLAMRQHKRHCTAECALSSADLAGAASLQLARTASAFHSFNGRLEAPAVWPSALAIEDAFARLDLWASGESSSVSDAITAWDFSRDMASADVEGSGPSGRRGRLHNLPTRAVKGSRWRGTEQSYLHAPRQYAAIHFHQDDLSDAKWPAAARLRLPETLTTGIYLIEITGAAGRDTLPVVVRQKKPKEKFAFLASTFTWLAYANDRCLLHGANPEMFANRLLVLTPNDCELASDHRYGLSLYDTHIDDSGVSYATRRRPCLSLRHNQRGWHGGIGSSLWNFGIDLLILAWFQREGISYDIVTDDDLDTEGVASLSPYYCVMTGCHPEYHTQRSVDAVRGFIEEGGRFIYLGGNGFYWRLSTHPDYPETVELRRAEDGNRSWASEPGEYYHAFDGAYGGLWRRNGQPPQALLGVGYCGQGFYKCHPYRFKAAASDPRVAFLMDKPPETGSLLGDFGLVGGGAVGLEIDRADRQLGTPDHALVIATSVPLDDSYILANEEIGVNRPTVSGAMSPALRADLVFFETPAGGAVLSTGSISWAGTMGARRDNNTVSMLTRNAIRRFSDPTPFTMPSV